MHYLLVSNCMLDGYLDEGRNGCRIANEIKFSLQRIATIIQMIQFFSLPKFSKLVG
jgi:hypothetical protein